MDFSKLIYSLTDHDMSDLYDLLSKERIRRFDESKYPEFTETEKNIYQKLGKLKVMVAYKLRTKLDSNICQLMVEKCLEHNDVKY